jgi:hypothetical protein
MLQAYNCDRQKPGEKVNHMPAEEEIYRPDYVKHHFVHYSTGTGMSMVNKEDVLKRGHQKYLSRSIISVCIYPQCCGKYNTG